MTSRLEKIQAMLADEPDDTFLRYSLAMEQEKLGEFESSEAGLRGLMADDPPYAQAHFMLAQFIVKRGRIAEAREILRTGIELARQQGNSHLAGEMGDLLASLGTLGE